MNPIKRLLPILAVSLLVPYTYCAEMIGIFADPDMTSTPLAGDIVGPLRFAAEDIKKALVAQKYDVEIRPISDLTSAYKNKKIVVALADNVMAKKVLLEQGGTAPAALGDQAYEMMTTSNGDVRWTATGRKHSI
jgi:hypothetical protein